MALIFNFVTGQQPFSVPEPAQGTVPVFPLPDKVRDVEKRAWSSSTNNLVWRMLPSHGMRRGNVLGLGSRIPECTSLNASTPKDGLQ